MRPTQKTYLSPRINHQLHAYELAAIAAGVTLLAGSPQATARIVCRTANASLLGTQTVRLNPASQQFPPFNLAQTFNAYSTTSGRFRHEDRAFFTPNTAGANDLLAANGLPAALAKGAVIGPNGNFGKGNSYGLLFTYGNIGGGTTNHHQGNFPLRKADYVGYKFSISGKDHFGWMRLRVDIQKLQTVTNFLQFGFETVPGKALGAGSCTDADESVAGNLTKEHHADLINADLSESGDATAKKQRGLSLGLLAAGSQR
jgi:hypothetical protein